MIPHLTGVWRGEVIDKSQVKSPGVPVLGLGGGSCLLSPLGAFHSPPIWETGAGPALFLSVPSGELVPEKTLLPGLPLPAQTYCLCKARKQFLCSTSGPSFVGG